MTRALALLALSGCSELVLLSSDVRLDEDDAGALVSEGARSCVGASGRVYVVWSDDRDGVPALYMNRSEDAGATWSGPYRVDHGTRGASAPDLACVSDPAGALPDTVYLAWQDVRDGELDSPNVYFNVSFDGGVTFGEQDVNLSGDPSGLRDSRGPRIVAQNDEVYVAWFDGAYGAYDILVRGSHEAGLTWNDVVRVDGDAPGAAYSAWPDLATDGEGHAHVAWEDSRDGGTDIYVASTSNGAFSFGPPTRLDVGPTAIADEDLPGVSNGFRPRVATLDDAVVVVWHDERNGPARDILLNASTDGGLTWQAAAARVDSDAAGAADSSTPDVRIVDGPDGPRWHVIWQDHRAGGYDIFHRAGDASGFAAAEVRLDTDLAGAGNSLEPRLATSEDGQDLVVVWEDRRDDTDGLGYNELYYVYSRDGGSTWSSDDLRVDSLAAGTSYKVDARVAVHGDHLIAAWTDGRSGTADVFFHTLELGEEARFLEVRGGDEVVEE
jgi:hypothetical protein